MKPPRRSRDLCADDERDLTSRLPVTLAVQRVHANEAVAVTSAVHADIDANVALVRQGLFAIVRVANDGRRRGANSIRPADMGAVVDMSARARLVVYGGMQL